MIISASRRTDIPAFFAEEFYNDLKCGYTNVMNPYNRKIIKVDLRRESVNLIVFWTKNVFPLLPFLSAVEDLGYPFFFHYTVNNYPEFVEPGIPELSMTIRNMRILSERIGRKKIVWRYDPIFVTDKTDLEFHLYNFSLIAENIHKFVGGIKISFYDEYPKVKKRIDKKSRGKFNVLDYPYENSIERIRIHEFLRKIKLISDKYRLPISSCSEKHGEELSKASIYPGACIDKYYIKELFDIENENSKDKGQRKLCNCIKSVDIGKYDTCKNGCIYCYATNDK